MHAACCIVGGGPAGMMLGYLLARAGLDVAVVEKHADFLRDFRGDTIHPSTLQIMHELGIVDEFLKRPHQEVRQLRGWIGRFELTIADFTHLPTHSKFLALMPQWDFLDFLAQQGKRYPGFHLMMQTQVTNLIEEGGRVSGVQVMTPEGPRDIRAELVVGADGRHSIVREKAGLVIENIGAPIDALWMRLTRNPTDRNETFGRFDRRKILAMLNRDTYWQIAYVIPKGAIDRIKAEGLDAFRNSLAELVPFLKDRMHELRTWDDVKLLTVRVDRLKEWYKPGLLCIGDAAHAMSPVGGVGINLAIQDAVAAANRLAKPLRENHVQLSDLEAVQRRRLFPTRVIQGFQVFAQNNILGTALGTTFSTLPFPLRVLQAIPLLQRIPAWFIGVGVRPEHVQTADSLRTQVRPHGV